MGCAQSTNAAADGGDASSRPMAEKSHVIDEEIKRAKSLERKTTKMLLLGAGESGKSTVVKQMKLQYQGATSDADRSEYVEVVVQNVLQSMQAILEALPDLQIRIDGDTAVLATLVSSAPPFISASEFRSELARPIWTLWKSRPIKEALARRNAFQLNDSADYFFQAVPRIAKPDYLPTEDDVLRSRVKTTGVIEHEIRIRDRLFKVTDVGGQRSERKKWLNVFESVSVLLFLASLAEYDQRLREDEAVSRLEESLTLFETIANSSWFASSTIILFLNKMDIFADKLAREPIENYVTGFPPGRGLDPEYASRWLRQRFLALRHDQSKAIYSHFTCATDTTGMKVVLGAVVDSVLRSNFASAGII